MNVEQPSYSTDYDSILERSLRIFPLHGGIEEAVPGPKSEPTATADDRFLPMALSRLETKLDLALQEIRSILGRTETTERADVLSNGMALTKAEVARLFKISQRSVDRLRASGMDLGELRVGATVRFDAEKIRQIITTKKIRRKRA